MIDATLRLPPCAIEAEECILGGIMLDPDAIDIVAVMLKPQDFYIEVHGKLFEVMLLLHQENKPTDLLFVDQKLKDLGIHQEIGGRNKLATLIDRTVSAVNIDALAELVIEKSTKRKMFTAGNIISQSALDAWVSAEESIQIAEEEIFKISQKQTGDRYQLASADRMSIELFEHIQSGRMEGQKFGWYDLEAITSGMHKGKLEVLAAESHMGKTHYLVDHAYNVMTQLQLPVLFFSLEMDQNQLNTRMLARITNIDSSEIINNPNRYMEDIVRGIEILGQLPWKVYDNSSTTVQNMASIVRRAITEFGCPLGAIYIDYLQQIPLPGKGLMSYEIGQITRDIRAIAKYHEVPIFLGCQVNRSNASAENKRPNKSMLRNSGEIFEVCDRLVMLYRPEYYTKDPSDKTIELIVEKNRITGKLGTATMLADLSTSRFINLAKPQQY